ncbi:Maf family protein [Noviherbaspirillum sp. Root189]|uniref:Maf family protein n=1 Tax=Noviherbaspirillum sp. Root189 TaxID=1736487 RepID=UPI00070FE4C6|nr:Maf family protein [Noviherbaspirillum sp. Root189]KRB93815.1 septum formation inhibitor Maf [Noviherbaspirillum sp. Root189]
MKPADNKIYLASKSPRRRELLRQIGVEFELLLLRDAAPRGPEVSEEVLSGEKAEDYVVRVTREKAEFASKMMMMRRLPARPVMSADTTVVIDGRILGKPADQVEAMDMLRALSGRTHQVLTSVALHRDDETWQTLQVSDVRIATLSEEMMRAYCATSEPYDKAGGYGIQGLASVFIEHIAGSYTGIMGLPLHETAKLLNQAGIPVLGSVS